MVALIARPEGSGVMRKGQYAEDASGKEPRIWYVLLEVPTAVANEQCIYTTDRARSSRSKSPTAAPPLVHVDTTQSIVNESASILPSEPSAQTIDYFSHLQTAQPTFTMNPANNAMSVWNPNTSTPSPSSLLASLFGPQAVDVFQPHVQSENQPSAFSFEDALRQSSASYPPTGGAQIDYSYNNVLPAVSSDPRLANGFGWQCHDLSTFHESERLSREVTSSDSTPISLNSDTAFNSAFSLVQPEFRDRPEHPSYLFQLQVLDQPDQMIQFFPSLEQRHQV